METVEPIVWDEEKARRESDEFINKNQFTEHDVAYLRRLCKVDLMFLGHFALGYKKLSPNLHGDISKWMKSTENEQFRLLLLPRSHYKSTLFTKADAVQIALPDDFKDQPYPRNLGTDVRMLIAHEKSGSAQRILMEITNHFTINPIIRALFPECIPQNREQRINTSELELPRQSHWGEPTFDTMGAGGKNQGRHYNLLKLDDIYGSEARDSQKERETIIDWFDNVQSFLITPKSDHIDTTGTRWAYDDVYSHKMKNYGVYDAEKNPKGRVHCYIRGAEEYNEETGKREPIFPEEFTSEAFEILKKNRRIWNAQYANDPREGAAKFQPEWLRYYNKNGRNYTIFDLQEPEEVHFEEMDRLIFLDPAVNGLSGLTVTGTTRKKKVLVLEALKDNWSPPEMVDELFRLVQRYQPRLVVIEYVLFSELFEHWLRTEQNVRGIRFRVEGARTGQKAKEVRIEGLANYFAAGQIFFNPDQKELIEEFHEFGASKNVHMLDSLAYGPKFWRAGSMDFMTNKYEDVQKKMMGGRDSWGGYSDV